MKFRIWIVALAAVACGAMNGGSGNMGGNSGTGGGANGGSGGGGSGGGGTGGTGGGGGSGGTGGSGGVGVVPDWTSGTRLRAKVLTSPDGAKAFSGLWHDTQLDLDCYAQIAGDGQRRCLPSTGAYISTFYADMGCSTPLAYVAAATATACPPTLAILTEAGTTCGDYGQAANKQHLYAVSGAYGGTVYTKSGANCPAYPNNGSFAFYSVGAEVPPSTYAPIDYVVE